MRVTLVVPHLLAVDAAALAREPALGRLARYAGAPLADPDGLDAAMVAAATGVRAGGTAALAALGAGFDPGTAYVLHADPVALVAGRDDVLLAGRIDDLDPPAAAALTAALNAHFAADGLAFHAPRPDAWFVTATGTAHPATTPLAAVRDAIYPHMPRGDRAKEWRLWLSEMQMLLHAHPVNAEREASGRAPATGVWIWGGGTLAAGGPPLAADVYAPAGTAGDVARGLARVAQRTAAPVPEAWAALRADHDALVVLSPCADAASLHEFAAAFLTPAVAALESRAVTRLALVADGAGRAFAWTAAPPSLRQRLGARMAAPPFVAPGADAAA